MNKINKKILVGLFLVQLVVFTVASNLMPVLQPTLIDKLDLAKDQISLFALIYTIGVVVSAISMPFIPILYNKLGLKASFIIGSILSAGGFFGLVFATEVWMFWVLAGIFNIGTGIVSALGIPYVISLWFSPISKGSAMGIAFSAGSIGNVVAMIIFNIIRPSVDNVDMIIMVAGALSLIVGVVVSVLIIREPKEEEKAIIFKEDKTDNKEEKAKDGYTLNEAFKSPMFWVVIVGLLFLGLYVAAMATQYPTYYKKALGAENIYLQIGLVFAFASVFGNFVGGKLFDKIGTRPTLFVGFAVVFTAALSLIFSPNILELGYLFGLMKGISVFTYIVLPGYIVGYLFGQKEYAKILSIIQLFFAVGFALGSFLITKIVEMTSWHTAWIVVLGFVFIAYGMLILATFMHDKNKK